MSTRFLCALPYTSFVNCSDMEIFLYSFVLQLSETLLLLTLIPVVVYFLYDLVVTCDCDYQFKFDCYWCTRFWLLLG
jgi:hypothetical protein